MFISCISKERKFQVIYRTLLPRNVLFLSLISEAVSELLKLPQIPSPIKRLENCSGIYKAFVSQRIVLYIPFFSE
jgi:hypothetical protein